MICVKNMKKKSWEWKIGFIIHVETGYTGVELNSTALVQPVSCFKLFYA